MKRENMESAFPLNSPDGLISLLGMTLRDYFAGQALEGLVTRFTDKNVAEKAYKLADAMLEEREKDE